MTPSTIFQQIHLGRASRDSWILPWHIAAPWTPCPVASTGSAMEKFNENGHIWQFWVGTCSKTPSENWIEKQLFVGV